MIKMPGIFLTLGTHPQQFYRLLKKVDELVGEKKIKQKVFAQTGHTNVKPNNIAFTKFLTLDEFNKKMREADIIITHAGEGNIGLAKKLGKKMIVMPRLKEFKEHTNDHQTELAETVEEKKLGLVAWNENELEEKLREIKSFKPASVPRGTIVQELEMFVKKEFK